ncbi:MAG TPA: hypothetical protein VHO01_04540 [Jatrophihabitans sp.]|nr:hypothetical protein [Jatrophihabitans sp.]
MIVPDPVAAPARPDLTFLRRRSARSAAATTRPPAAGIDYVHHEQVAAAPPPVASPAAPSLSQAVAPAGGELDLSSPAGQGAPVPSELGGAGLLDLSSQAAPAPAAAPSPAASVVVAQAQLPPTASSPAGAAPVTFDVARVQAGTAWVLTPTQPTVTLTRLQSGVGALTIEAACSPAVGNLRLGCAWELRGGQSSVVQASSGIGLGPAGSARPVLLADRDQFERLRLDLRQVRELNRLIVYAFSESGGTLSWGGTLVLSTAGGARIELPLDRPAAASVQVLLSVYQVEGELVVRAEMEHFAGAAIRPAVDAYDFHHITWLDPRTPLN